MKKVEILFFGQLKEIWGCSKKNWQTECVNINDLYTELLRTISDPPYKGNIKVAINDEFCNWSTEISDNDSIAFLPPASGG